VAGEDAKETRNRGDRNSQIDYSEKLKAIHEITRSGTKNKSLVPVISCSFVDRHLLR
jgi:hypothetical protein